MKNVHFLSLQISSRINSVNPHEVTLISNSMKLTHLNQHLNLCLGSFNYRHSDNTDNYLNSGVLRLFLYSVHVYNHAYSIVFYDEWQWKAEIKMHGVKLTQWQIEQWAGGTCI